MTNTTATDSEQARELELGITRETVETYKYKTHVYNKLSDALKYAEIDRGSATPEAEAPSNERSSEGKSHE